MNNAANPADHRAGYEDKTGPYFDNVRRDIAPLLPAFADQVLEVGCGAGATLQWLKQSGRCARTVAPCCCSTSPPPACTLTTSPS